MPDRYFFIFVSNAILLVLNCTSYLLVYSPHSHRKQHFANRIPGIVAIPGIRRLKKIERSL